MSKTDRHDQADALVADQAGYVTIPQVARAAGCDQQRVEAVMAEKAIRGKPYKLSLADAKTVAVEIAKGADSTRPEPELNTRDNA
jgi:hypothetical protein